MNQQDKSFLTTFTTVIAVLVMLAVAIFMVSRLVAVMASKPDDGSRRMATLTKRIAPIGEVAVAGMPAPSTATGPTATTSPAPASQQVAAASPASGEAVYNQACAACHTAGVLNAPKYGSKEQWETRYAQGLDTLVTHAVNGINAMPAKGGHPSLTESEIEASIVYMLEGSGIEVTEATTEVAAAPAESTAAPAEPAESAAASTPAPAQQPEAPAQTAAAPAAPAAPAPKAPATTPVQMGSSSVQEVTLAASEATNAASQAAAAASQAASAASQAAAAASQAAAAVSQAIDMLREMAVKPAAAPATESSTPEPVPAPQSEVEPAAPASATTTKPSATAVPAAKPIAKAAPLTKPKISEPLHAKPVAPKIPKPAANATETTTKPAATPAPAPEKPQASLQEAKPTAPPAEAAPASQTESAPAAATAPQQTAAVTAEPTAAEPAEIAVEIPPDIHLGRGKQLYNTACVICHQAGVAGAPKLGDKAAWEPRLSQGFDTLVEHSLKGYKGMPPKGGRLDVPDEEIISAVGYMLSELE